eukprot:GHVU01006684.1.p1 GENE.GHVU01006684.1~~GHVU01006684.1.p1  ORF type:complete len:259 (+),score=8.28 GHVU01006684.1:104-880(+)
MVIQSILTWLLALLTTFWWWIGKWTTAAFSMVFARAEDCRHWKVTHRPCRRVGPQGVRTPPISRRAREVAEAGIKLRRARKYAAELRRVSQSAETPIPTFLWESCLLLMTVNIMMNPMHSHLLEEVQAVDVTNAHLAQQKRADDLNNAELNVVQTREPYLPDDIEREVEEESMTRDMQYASPAVDVSHKISDVDAADLDFDPVVSKPTTPRKSRRQRKVDGVTEVSKGKTKHSTTPVCNTNHVTCVHACERVVVCICV